MTWLEAIRHVLQSAEAPMHYTEIAQAVIDNRYRTDPGATPSATVAAVLSQKPLQSEVERLERGIYRLPPARSAVSLNETGMLATGPATVLPDPTSDVVASGLINAFGIFWRQSNVDWASGSVKLFGSQVSGSAAIDFGQQAGVYLLYDGSRLVYAGQAGDGRLASRLWDHTRDRLTGRRDRFSWFGLRPVRADGTLGGTPPSAARLDLLIDTLEALLIEVLEPPQKRRQGDGFKGLEFIQQVDPGLRNVANGRCWTSSRPGCRRSL